MPFDPTEEGDTLDAASIDDRLKEARDELNDITRDQVARRRLGRHHLPDLLDPYGLFTQYTGGSDDALVAVERYDNTIPDGGGGASGGIEQYLETFALPGAYGPYTRPLGGIAAQGWLIPRSVGAPEGMNVVLNSATNLDDDSLVGIKATAWIDIRDMAREPSGNDPLANTSVAYGEAAVYLGIGIRDSTGQRHVIQRSIRRLGSVAGPFGPMSTMTVIQPGDLNAGTLNGTVLEIFGAVISGVWDSELNQHGNVEVEIKQFNIAVEPIRAGELV